MAYDSSRHRFRHTCNLNEEDELFMQAVAARAGRGVGPLLAEGGVAYHRRQVVVPPKVVAALNRMREEITFEINKVGTNLNQIAHKVNAKQQADRAAVESAIESGLEMKRILLAKTDQLEATLRALPRYLTS